MNSCVQQTCNCYRNKLQKNRGISFKLIISFCNFSSFFSQMNFFFVPPFLFFFFFFPCSLPSDLMKAIFITGAKTNEGWEFLLKMYSSSVSEAEKSKMIEALASTEDVRKLIWYERDKDLYCVN